jgi:hypothetical protein
MPFERLSELFPSLLIVLNGLSYRLVGLYVKYKAFSYLYGFKEGNSGATSSFERCEDPRGLRNVLRDLE